MSRSAKEEALACLWFIVALLCRAQSLKWFMWIATWWGVVATVASVSYAIADRNKGD
jgi:hypothetical protein